VSEQINAGVIARGEATWQSHFIIREIATSLRSSQ